MPLPTEDRSHVPAAQTGRNAGKRQLFHDLSRRETPVYHVVCLCVRSPHIAAVVIFQHRQEKIIPVHCVKVPFTSLRSTISMFFLFFLFFFKGNLYQDQQSSGINFHFASSNLTMLICKSQRTVESYHHLSNDAKTAAEKGKKTTEGMTERYCRKYN